LTTRCLKVKGNFGIPTTVNIFQSVLFRYKLQAIVGHRVPVPLHVLPKQAVAKHFCPRRHSLLPAPLASRKPFQIYHHWLVRFSGNNISDFLFKTFNLHFVALFN
jgi:hypothetical protein